MRVATGADPRLTRSRCRSWGRAPRSSDPGRRGTHVLRSAEGGAKAAEGGVELVGPRRAGVDAQVQVPAPVDHYPGAPSGHPSYRPLLIHHLGQRRPGSLHRGAPTDHRPELLVQSRACSGGHPP